MTCTLVVSIAVALLALLLDSAAAHGASQSPYSRPVNTTSGLVIGHAASNRSEVSEFLGVRYAEPPVGNLRFAPPKRYYASPNTVYNASNWGPDCLANKPPVSMFPNFSEPSGFHVWNMFAAQNGNPSSEDCLSLNIWTKTPDSSVRRPVLIWFHGGRKFMTISTFLNLLSALVANSGPKGSQYLVLTVHFTTGNISQPLRTSWS